MLRDLFHRYENVLLAKMCFTEMQLSSGDKSHLSSGQIKTQTEFTSSRIFSPK